MLSDPLPVHFLSYCCMMKHPERDDFGGGPRWFCYCSEFDQLQISSIWSCVLYFCPWIGRFIHFYLIFKLNLKPVSYYQGPGDPFLQVIMAINRDFLRKQRYQLAIHFSYRLADYFCMSLKAVSEFYQQPLKSYDFSVVNSTYFNSVSRSKVIADHRYLQTDFRKQMVNWLNMVLIYLRQTL